MPDERRKRGLALRLVCRLTAGALLAGCGDSSTTAPEPQPPAQTPAGVPNGLPTTVTIGAAGGSLASGDGRLSITVPPGAVAAGTVVTIQPITATAPGALGSYQLTPEGVTFAQPVSLTFTYPADEALATDPQSLRVATQDERGYWIVMPASHNAAQRKLTVTTTHFSAWSYVAGVQIKPASATVEVNKQLNLEVIDCGVGSDPGGGNSGQLLLLQCLDQDLLEPAQSWSVNGIANGNTTVGTVVGLPSTATYTAPGAVPGQNPVAVSAQVGQLGRPTGRITLISNVRVVDELTEYTGSISGRLTVTVGNVSGFHELNATNVRFVYNPDLSIGGDIWYDGTGSAVVRAQPLGCSSIGTGTASLAEASLVLHTSGPLAGTYTVNAGAVATLTMQCGNPPASVTSPIVGSAAAGGSDICPSLQIGNDPSRLAGSWSCNVSEGAYAIASWNLVKSDAGQVLRRKRATVRP